MPTQQIPKEKWLEYLEGFSAHNQTRNIVVDFEDSETGAQRVIDGLPLLAVDPDMKRFDPMIAIIAGDPQGGTPESMTHEVTNPKAIWVKENEEGVVQAMDIETESGRTIIQFS